jgi:hypothetical protein
MKNITRLILTIAAGLLLVAAPNVVRGQTKTGLMQEAWDTFATSTNFAVIGFYGRGLTGNKNVAGGDYIYNLTHNETANAALILGGDFLWARGTNNANVVRGGLNLGAKIYPLKQFGYTNFYTTVFAFDTIASPVNASDGTIGNVIGTGADFKWRLWKRLDFHIGGFYDNRVGQGRWDGNYLNADAGLSWAW